MPLTPKRVFHHKTNPSLGVRGNKAMKTFKKIIVGTDFSDNAAAAFHYAHQLATRLKAELHVVNVYEIPINPGSPQYLDYMPTLDELEKSATARLARFVSDTSDAGNTMVASRVKVTSETMIGFPADRFIELSKDPSVDLIVVGTAGETGWMDKIFGSVAIKIATEAHCPVLMVPNNADYKHIRHLLYAASFESASPKDIHLTLDWTKYFMGDIHFVHVNTPTSKYTKMDKLTFQKLLETEHTKVPYEVNTIGADTIQHGIQAYTEENAIDMIIAVTRHRSFWESMTHPSVTKALAWNTHIPMMILHSDDKEKGVF